MMLEDLTLLDVAPVKTEKPCVVNIFLAIVLGVLLAAFAIGSAVLMPYVH